MEFSKETWETDLKLRVDEALIATFGIAKPMRTGKVGPHLLAKFQTREAALQAVEAVFAVALKEAKQGDYVTSLAGPAVELSLRNKRDEVMRTMLTLLKFHHQQIPEASMKSLFKTTIETCEAAKEVLLPWLEQLQQPDVLPAVSVLSEEEMADAAAVWVSCSPDRKKGSEVCR